MQRYSAIRYAVRPGVVVKYLFQIYSLLGSLTLIPACVALASGRWLTAGVYLAVAGLMLLMGFFGRRMPGPARLQRNEAAVVVSLVFITSSLAMALPIMTYGVGLLDAWFESVSGITTTGLSTLDTADMPDSLLFARGWSQWVGGVGVVVLALAVLIRPGHATRSLGFTQNEMGKVVGGSRAHARRVIVIYVTLTAIGVAALFAVGADALDAVVLAMTAVSTGGFATAPDSLAGLSTLESGIVNLLCLAGAISFYVYYVSLLGLGQLKRLDNQLYGLLATVAALTLLILAISSWAGSPISPFDTFSLVVSAQTTAGFSTRDLGNLPDWLLLLVVAAMFVGGGIGSTSGGIKLGRLMFVLSWVRTYFLRTSMPESAYVDVRVGGRRVDDGDVQDVFAVIGAFIVVLFVSWFLFVLHGYPAAAALFEVTSALGTAGLSVGITGAELEPFLKFVLCLNMLLGRVEVVALLVILLPRTWIGRRRGLGTAA